ncbi:MAG: hypothetical protein HY785_05485 [Oscillatoriophycideae cyanobacterium NC_groundwater_1537_Pr4_S-0.65um_50_18]|nr:hypothetical protein [Oscillatoriophycideae cyanobacterium NC_groundwater_1537_Pr4_S-0.65um_50_18]
MAEQPNTRLNTRQVVRRISSTFWFFREILPYGEDCVIIGIESLRNRFITKLRSLYKPYEL